MGLPAPAGARHVPVSSCTLDPFQSSGRVTSPACTGFEGRGARSGAPAPLPPDKQARIRSGRAASEGLGNSGRRIGPTEPSGVVATCAGLYSPPRNKTKYPLLDYQPHSRANYAQVCAVWEHGPAHCLAALARRVAEPQTGADFGGERGRGGKSVRGTGRKRVSIEFWDSAERHDRPVPWPAEVSSTENSTGP